MSISYAQGSFYNYESIPEYITMSKFRINQKLQTPLHWFIPLLHKIMQNTIFFTDPCLVHNRNYLQQRQCISVIDLNGLSFVMWYKQTYSLKIVYFPV